jgi:tetratricopeptide (TPR) repeat protein
MTDVSTKPIPARREVAAATSTWLAAQESPLFWLGLAAILMLAEHLAGPLVQLTAWYIVPVGFAAWYGESRWGVALAVTMPLVAAALLLAGPSEQSGRTLAALAFNTLTQIAAFSLLAVTAARLARQHKQVAVDLREAEAGHQQLKRQLHALERRGKSAPVQLRLKLLNRAAELCAVAGERAGAAVYYGRAIDTLLDSGEYDRAAMLCRKLIRVFPEVVRAHATLAVIAIGKNLTGDAERHLEDYVGAAIWAERESLTRARLRAIAEAADDEQLRSTIAHHLWQLGDHTGSKKILYPELAGAAPGGSAAALDPEERWQRLIALARMGPDELRRLA